MWRGGAIHDCGCERERRGVGGDRVVGDGMVVGDAKIVGDSCVPVSEGATGDGEARRSWRRRSITPDVECDAERQAGGIYTASGTVRS